MENDGGNSFFVSWSMKKFRGDECKDPYKHCLYNWIICSMVYSKTKYIFLLPTDQFSFLENVEIYDKEYKT